MDVVVELAFNCGHTISVALTDNRFLFADGEVRYAGRGVLYCQECWRRHGKSTWKEPGDFFTYAKEVTRE